MVTHGKINFPWWTLQDLEDLEYVNEPFNDPDSLALWKSLGYTQTTFTGDLYDMRKTELYWISKFKRIDACMHLKNVSWAFYRMKPGTTLPKHSDTYKRFVQIHNIDNIDNIQRTVVFLEDWQSGHYFEINNTPIINWKKGQTVTWRGGTEHLAANVGMTNRYTLQITGIA